jgi:virulence-associated protein VapD
MKRIFLSLALAGLFSGLFAQSVDKAKDLLKGKKLTEAKTEIDNALTVEKNQKNAEAWYTKVKIYNAIAADSTLKSTVPDAYVQSLAALKKYAELDEKKLVLLTLDQYKPINEIYQGLFQQGAGNYNEKKYPEAYSDFTHAIEAIGFMNQKGWIKQNMDTTSTLYAGISAEKAGKRDDAAKYYTQIADSGITKIGGNDMAEIYKWVTDYYNRKGDKANTAKYVAIGKAKYPKELFFDELVLDDLRKNGPKDSLFAKYDQIIKERPDSAIYFFNYGLELYQYSSDTTKGPLPSNADALIKKSQEMLAQSLKLNPDYPQANLVMGQISYNQGIEIQQQTKAIKGSKPEDLKKRAEIKAEAIKKFDEAIPYFEKIDQLLGKQGELKRADKSALKDAYDLLVTIYEQKKDKDKAAAWTDKYNNVEKVH